MKIAYKMLALVLLTAPCLTHAQISIGASCSGSQLRSEGRTVDLVHYGAKVSYPIATDDYNARYCVTREKCVALGYCKARSPAEQAAADKLNPEAAAERARLQRERRQREAQAERQRKAAEDERNRKEAEVAQETRRLGSHREAEARRLVEMREAAEKARPKAQGSPSIGNDRKAEELACRMVTGQGTQKVPFNFTSREAAESALRFDASRSCKSSPNAGNVPIFSNLGCRSKQERGLTSGKLRDFWSCSASFKCSMPHEVCEGKSAQGSAQ